MLQLGKNLKPKTTFFGIIYGTPGVGKTTLALSAKNPILLDCDNGAERVEYPYRAEVPVLKPQSFKDIMDTITTNIVIDGKEYEYDTVVIDTIGMLVEYALEQVMIDDPKMRQRDGTPVIKAYGAISNPIKKLKDTAIMAGKSLLIIGHADEKDTNNGLTYRVQCSGSTANKLISMADFVGFMDMNGTQRTITFTPSDHAFAKNALGLPENIKVPDPSTCGNNFIQKVIDSAIAKRTQESHEVQSRFDELIKKMQSAVAAAKDAEGMNVVWDWGKIINHIWESKARFSEMLKNRSTELNVMFSKEEGKFVAQTEEDAQ